MSEDESDPSSKEVNNTTRGFILGMVFGVSFGLILWLATGSIFFIPAFLAAGMTLGMVIGSTRDKQDREKKDPNKAPSSPMPQLTPYLLAGTPGP